MIKMDFHFKVSVQAIVPCIDTYNGGVVLLLDEVEMLD